MTRKTTDYGWYLAFGILAILSCLLIYVVSGSDAFGAAGLLVWNGAVFVVNMFIRLLSSFSSMLARGVGFRRLSRMFTAIGGIGLGYAGSVVLSDEKMAKAHGWREKLRASLQRVGEGWRGFSLPVKLAIVVVMIAVQLYLHWFLIVFPIGFLVPVVRRAWVQVADTAFGAWYWRTFGKWHRATVTWGRRLPVIRHFIEYVRLMRLRYLCAWRLWRHHPRYRNEETGRRVISLVEPLRLWWRGDLDHYVGRPLLSGPR